MVKPVDPQPPSARPTAECIRSCPLVAALADHALHDQLTGLPNRWLLEDRFRELLLGARRTGASFAVLLLDVNDFKHLNDELGHLAGDEALRLVARRLSSAVRAADTVARIGGDEFVLLLGHAQREGEAYVIAKRILASLAEPTVIAGRRIKIRVSIGAALFPRDGQDLMSLLDHADQAMYDAKRQHSGYELFVSQPREVRSLGARQGELRATA